jgi:hypothetical protein
MTVIEIPIPEQLPEYTVERGTVYSNFDHELRPDVFDHIQPGHGAFHAAWDYCGIVWRTEGGFAEVVMQYHVPQAAYACGDLATLIGHVVAEWGDA